MSHQIDRDGGEDWPYSLVKRKSDYDQEGSRTLPTMKILARLLVVVALICVSLFAVHGFFLVRSDIAIQKSATSISQSPTPAPGATPASRPSAAVVKRDVDAAPAAEPRVRNGGSEAEGSSPVERQAQTETAPETHTTTISFMPAQTANFPNRGFRKVLIRSEYPLRILTGRCHSDYTVEFFCNGDPADIFITDTRRQPIFMTPRANSITITVTAF